MMNSIAMIASLMKLGKPGLLVGPPGTAKSARIDAARKSIDFEVELVRAGLADRVDFGGCLVPNTELSVTQQLPLEWLKKLKNTTKNTVLFLDDVFMAHLDVQGALMQLFDPGFFPKNIVIWGASNRPKDKVGVMCVCEALRSRFRLAYSLPTPDSREVPTGAVMLGTWKDEGENWCDWANESGYGGPITAYHRFTSFKHLYKWQPEADPAIRMADFRSWETVAELYTAGVRDTITLGGAIGLPDASAFLSFASTKDELSPPEEVFKSPSTAKVPDEKNTAAMYLMASSVSAAVSNKTAAAMIIYSERMPRMFGAMMVRDAHKRLRKELSTNPAWVAWYAKNQEIFRDQ